MQVGIHPQLRATAETVLLEVAGSVSTRSEAFTFLFWSPGCGPALFEAMSQSVSQLSALAPPQALPATPFFHFFHRTDSQTAALTGYLMACTSFLASASNMSEESDSD